MPAYGLGHTQSTKILQKLDICFLVMHAVMHFWTECTICFFAYVFLSFLTSIFWTEHNIFFCICLMIHKTHVFFGMLNYVGMGVLYCRKYYLNQENLVMMMCSHTYMKE
jgi:hypothetical protein